MMRSAAVCALFALGLYVGVGSADDAKPAKNQMVKGTIKSVDGKTGVLVVNQKVKDNTVERQLDITDKTEFVITEGTDKKEVSGKEALFLLEGKEGSQVTVKCDKDVNVLKVTVTIKK